MRAILQKQAQHLSEGKESIFFIRGREVLYILQTWRDSPSERIPEEDSALAKRPRVSAVGKYTMLCLMLLGLPAHMRYVTPTVTSPRSPVRLSRPPNGTEICGPPRSGAGYISNADMEERQKLLSTPTSTVQECEGAVSFFGFEKGMPDKTIQQTERHDNARFSL